MHYTPGYGTPYQARGGALNLPGLVNFFGGGALHFITGIIMHQQLFFTFCYGSRIIFMM